MRGRAALPQLYVKRVWAGVGDPAATAYRLL